MKQWNGKPYYSFDYMLRNRFGEKVYKVALNGRMSCPNRTGRWERAAAFSAAQAVPVILPQIPLFLSHSRLNSR